MTTPPDVPEGTAHTRYLSREAYDRERNRYFGLLTPEEQALVAIWLRLGRQNPWIRKAWDPPFDELSFILCGDVRHLAEMIFRGNWCLGKAFALGDICFINQMDGGDEWLTIKGRTAFESITMRTFNETRTKAEARLKETIERIRTATEAQCRRLEY